LLSFASTWLPPSPGTVTRKEVTFKHQGLGIALCLLFREEEEHTNKIQNWMMTRTSKGTCILHFFRNAIITCHLYIPKGARTAQSVCLAKELGEKGIMIWFLAEASLFFTSNCQHQLRDPPNLFFSRNQNSQYASQGIGLTTHLRPILRLQLSSARLPTLCANFLPLLPKLCYILKESTR